MLQPRCLPPKIAGPCQDPLKLDANGHSKHPMIVRKITGHLSKGELTQVNGIIVHQTNAPKAQNTFNQYANSKNDHGAHFLIDKAGIIYQTASLFKRTWHVGKLRSRCVAEARCIPTNPRKTSQIEIAHIKSLTPKSRHDYEKIKPFPQRYPMNGDSIGIEIVGTALESPKGSNNWVYEAVNELQNKALTWLVQQLSTQFGVHFNNVFAHPTVSQKNPTEASTAHWNLPAGTVER